jgi:hypothetical protein
MTERAFPLGTPAPRRAETSAAPHLRALPTTLPTARAVPRAATATRRPIHVAVAVGVTAGLYAVSLAGVTALQHDTDARLAAERAPAGAAVEALRSAHDALDADLAGLSSGYAGAAESYRLVADRIGAHESALGALGTRVAAIEGSASSLRVPTVPRLPALSSRTVVVASKPVSNACTTASGKPC